MTNNSIGEFKEAMDTIKARGIVKTNILKSDALYRYDFNTGKFKPYDKKKLYRLFNRLYLNSYDVNYSINAIINDLEAIDLKQVDNYYKYLDAMAVNYDLADLENQANNFLKLNNENKKEIHTIYWKPQSQLQQLINNDVFTNGKILCKYNPGGKYFDTILPKMVMKFFRNVKNKQHLSAIGVENNYHFYIDNLIDIGGLYEDFKAYHNSENILKNCKKDYEVVKTIIDNFN